MEDIILQENFHDPEKLWSPYQVTLTRSQLRVDHDTPYTELYPWATSIALRDVLIAKVSNTRINHAMIQLICYFKDAATKKRQRKDVSFCVSQGTAEKNQSTVQLWVKWIRWLMYDSNISLNELQAKDTYPPCRNFLVLVNPISGTGQSLTLFREQVESMLKIAEIDYDTIITDHKEHAWAIAYAMDLKRYSGILMCSGDGTIYQFVNGLMNRSDWELAIKMPLAHIPIGTGNSTYCSVACASGEGYDIETATYTALRGTPKPKNVCSIKIGERTRYSMVSFSWGMASDIVRLAERFRFLGYFRFLLASLVYILFPTQHHGKFSYMPSICEKPPQIALSTKNRWQENSGFEVEMSDSCDVKKYGDNYQWATTNECSNKVHGNSKLPYYIKETENQLKYRQREENLTGIEQSVFPRISTLSRNDGIDSDYDNYSEENTNQFGVSKWKVISGEFVFVVAALVARSNQDYAMAPGLGICDESICLIYQREMTSRIQSLQSYSFMANDEKCPHYNYASITEFRLEPGNKLGDAAIDGEILNYNGEHIHGKLLRGLAQVYSM